MLKITKHETGMADKNYKIKGHFVKKQTYVGESLFERKFLENFVRHFEHKLKRNFCCDFLHPPNCFLPLVKQF